MNKFWMVMQKSETMKNRPLEFKYDSKNEAIDNAHRKCSTNKRPYIVLEAIGICEVVEAPTEYNEITS